MLKSLKGKRGHVCEHPIKILFAPIVPKVKNFTHSLQAKEVDATFFLWEGQGRFNVVEH